MRKRLAALIGFEETGIWASRFRQPKTSSHEWMACVHSLPTSSRHVNRCGILSCAHQHFRLKSVTCPRLLVGNAAQICDFVEQLCMIQKSQHRQISQQRAFLVRSRVPFPQGASQVDLKPIRPPFSPITMFKRSSCSLPCQPSRLGHG